MAKKDNTIFWIIGIVILIVILSSSTFSTFIRELFVTTPPEIKGVDDKGVKLSVYGWIEGEKVGLISSLYKGELFSIVEFEPPGVPISGLDAISIEHTISSPIAYSEVDVDVLDIIGSFTTDGLGGVLLVDGDGRYETSLSGLTQSFSLIPGDFLIEEGLPFNILDLEGDCNDFPYCEFKLQVIASFEDVDPDTGQMIITNILLNESYGTIILKISGEACLDGTPFGQCSLSAPGGQFCDGLNGLIACADPTGCTSPTYGAMSCSCDAGYYETNGDAICGAPMCDGGLAAGMCVGEYALICDPDCTQEYCEATIQNCGLCGQSGQEAGTPLGWLDAISNAAECPPAYNGDPSYECHAIQYLCKYKGKKADISVILG